MMSDYLQAERAQEWREALRNTMKNKDRTAIPRVKMPEADPQVRSHTYDEVNMGLTAELAIGEAHRCLDCVNPTCITGCPVEINIPKFVKNIERG
ncbi:MAG: dihydropyrimidine dehydrogenase, partial [Proteiniphilum sp.]|nr:dihydropyrimidine dehydrogenase [Proteiniphilum sp.]